MKLDHKDQVSEFQVQLQLFFEQLKQKYTSVNSLYSPIFYTLESGGKRFRPMLSYYGNKIAGGNGLAALGAAAAIELFHSFTLIHDDIMDNAPLRRGRTTVFKQFGLNSAVLSGDAMMIMAIQCFEGYEASVVKSLLSRFSSIALEVCEGQQMDMDFEQHEAVAVEAYIEMIRLKTSVLLGFALEAGAIIANATPEQQKALYNFGENIGIAFQIKDDWLDVFGQSDKVGKQHAGDILSSKKTLPYLETLTAIDSNKKAEFINLYHNSSEDKVEKVLSYYNKYNISKKIEIAMNKYYQLAVDAMLKTPNLEIETKTNLIALAKYLIKREE